MVERLSQTGDFQKAKGWFDERAREWEQMDPTEQERRRQEQELEEKRRRDAELEARIKQRLGVIPSRYRDIRFEWPSEVASWVSAFLNGRGRNVPSLLLSGQLGVGKTAVACMVLRAAIHADIPGLVIFENFRSLLRRLRPGGDATSEVVDEFCRATLVCLDDVGSHKGSEWAEEQLLEIVDSRYNWERPLVITVNVNPEELGEHVGDRVASRLEETSLSVVMSGPDRRRTR